MVAASDIVGQFDRTAVDQWVRERLDGWQALLATTRVADGRQFLREALEGPLLFTPDGRTLRFEGSVRYEQLIAGAIGDQLQPLWRARPTFARRATVRSGLNLYVACQP